MRRSAPALMLGLYLLGSSLAAAVEIKTLTDPSELPSTLAKFAARGDFVIRDGRYLALLAGSSRTFLSTLNMAMPDPLGCLLAFVPEGRSARALVQIGLPSLRIQGRAQTVAYASVKPEAGGLVARAAWSGPAKQRLDIKTRYDFLLAEGKIVLTSEIRNSGPADIDAVSFGIGANALQSYSFSPFNARAFPGLNFRVYQRPDHALGWFNPNPLETSEKPLPGRLLPGRTYRVVYSLLARPDLVSTLDKLYALAKVRPERASLEWKGVEGPAEAIVREPATGAIFFRAFMETAVPVEIPVLKGTYALRTNAFPASREQTVTAGGGASKWTAAVPVLGTVRVSIRDRRGRHVPGKVSFIGLDPTPSPYFLPENPVRTGRSWEQAKNSVYPPEGGMDVVLPAGVYLAGSSRGPEYTRELQTVEVLGGGRLELDFVLERAVETPGLVSLDSHMHTQFSDGNMLVPARLKSAVVEGLDAVVSSDHNTVTDYRTDLEGLGLNGLLAVIHGEEVTARSGSVHFNVFPVVREADKPNNGAIAVDDETPAALFALGRAEGPGALIHLNHPRSRGLGYFLTYELDPDKAAAARAPFDPGFEVLEAMNGSRLGAANRQSIEDWFHFLNMGYPVRAVGTSDSHGIDGSEPGYSRTYVLHAGPKGRDLDEAALVRSVREGRSFVSNGPIVSARIGRATFGDTVKAKKGRVALAVKVSAAPWMSISEVRVVVNGARTSVFPVSSPARGPVRFDKTIRLRVDRDSWISVEAIGAESLYPLIQQRSGDGTPGNAARPYALSNPIFVDADRNGRLDPVWPERIAVR